MEDLRVLEHQRCESQHLLASVKLTKEYLLEQRLDLDSQLSKVKYLNGTTRAQLLYARDVLSQKTREIGCARLRSERASENLQKFDEKLKKSIDNIRVLFIKRFQLDSAIAKLQNIVASFKRQKTKNEERLRIFEMKRCGAKQQEQLLINTIQTDKMKVSQLAEQTRKMRFVIVNFEEDFSKSRQMETSTRYHAESIASEIESENRMHLDSKHTLEMNIIHNRQRKAELSLKVQGLELAIVTTKRKIEQACEGHTPSTNPKNLLIDVARFRVAVENEKVLVLRTIMEHESIQEQTQRYHSSIIIFKNEIKSIQLDISNNEQYVDEQDKVQKNRASSHKTAVMEIEAVRKKVQLLRSSANERRKDLKTMERSFVDIGAERQLLMTVTKERLNAVLLELKIVDAHYRRAKLTGEKEQIYWALYIKEARNRADNEREAYETTQKKDEIFAKSHEHAFAHKISEIGRVTNEIKRKTSNEVIKLVERKSSFSLYVRPT